MKLTNYYLLIFLLNYWNSFSQTLHTDTLILSNEFNIISNSGQITYIDSVSSNWQTLVSLRKTIQKGILTEKGTDKRIILTTKERNTITKTLNNSTIWAKNLFSNSIMIKNQDIWKTLEQDKIRLNPKTGKLDKNNIPISMTKRPYVFVFSKPIYIRKNTLCIITYSAICGQECGITRSCVYQFVNGEWTKSMTILNGDF